MSIEFGFSMDVLTRLLKPNFLKPGEEIVEWGIRNEQFWINVEVEEETDGD